MSQPAEIKEALRAALAAKVDSHLSSSGFVRAARSLTYARSVGATRQAIEVLVQSRPMDNRNAAAAVYPYLSVVMPEVEDALAKLEGAEADQQASTYRAPIGWASCKAHPGRWFVFQRSSIEAVAEGLIEFWDQWLAEFVDELASANALIDLYGRTDPRLIVDERTALRVVAATMLVRGRAEALKILEQRFGAPGLRRRHKAAFDNLAG